MITEQAEKRPKGRGRAPLWQPGQSGNPNGRPKTVNEFKDLLKGDLHAARDALLAALHKPGERVGAATVIFQYVLGKPHQNVNVRVIQAIEDLSESELRAIAGLAEGAVIEAQAEESEDNG